MKHVFPKSDGFTLIEILVVISIITILAGLTISTFSYAQTSAGRNRAKAEVNGLSVAIESYKIDNGDYPRDATAKAATDTLDATKSISGDTVIPPYKSATPTVSSQQPLVIPSSVVLYQALSGDTNGDLAVDSDASGNKNKVYFPFKKNMLSIAASGTVQAIADPFKNAYGYSTLGTATSGSSGYNPTFDLWSTADFARTGVSSTNAWISNW